MSNPIIISRNYLLKPFSPYINDYTKSAKWGNGRWDQSQCTFLPLKWRHRHISMDCIDLLKEYAIVKIDFLPRINSVVSYYRCRGISVSTTNFNAYIVLVCATFDGQKALVIYWLSKVCRIDLSRCFRFQLLYLF